MKNRFHNTSPQAKNVLHIVKTRLLVDHPFCRPGGAAGEHVPGVGAVGDLDPLAHADEIHGMVADYIPAADGLHADLLLGSFAADPLTVEIGNLVVIATQRLGHDFTHAHRGAG